MPGDRLAGALAPIGLLLGLAGCGEDPTPAPPGALAPVEDRLAQVQSDLDAWRDATDVATAHRAAEAVANAITGPGTTGFGDRDGDGVIAGDTAAGLLPGEDGTPGLASPLSGCAGPDLLGGPWDEPAARWAELFERIDTWTPSTNRFPELPSHALRVVGWATLTLGSDDLAEAHEYAGHAQLHVTASVAAAADCA